MELFFMTLTTGILVGGIYALVALGWVLIYKCSGVLNLAMGELTLIGAYISLSFYAMGIPFLLALLFSLIIGFILGILTERIFLDKLIGEPVLTVIMVTVGLSFFFKGCVELMWGTDTQVFTPPVFSIEPIRLGPSARFVYATAWAIAFMAAGVGGTLLGNINGLNISVGYLGLLVLPAVVLGGLNSIPGAIMGGIIIGILQNFSIWIGTSLAASKKSHRLLLWPFSCCLSRTDSGAGRE
jgi:branched-chain amino acid transport system permease protein